MTEIEKTNQIQTNIFNNLRTHTHEVMDELSQLKDTYRAQCDTFVNEVRKLDSIIIDHSEKLQLRCNKLDNVVDSHKMKLSLHESNIGELYTRMRTAEEEIVKLHTETVRLDRVKTELSLFLKTKKTFELKNIEQDVKLFKCTNHVVTHDNFYDKYLPIRTQALINETLRSVLSGKERRRLELYDNDKNSLLYQALLCDDGTGDIL